MQKYRVIVFADGACKGNPGKGAWAFVLADIKNNLVIEKGAVALHTTNNKMEMSALLMALEEINKLKLTASERVLFCLDSNYVIQGASKWIHGWKKNNWKKSNGESVLNLELWQNIDEVIASIPSKLDWQHVHGHSGTPGNERVDEIASALAEESSINLYTGSLDSYPLNIFDVEDRQNKSKKITPYYISLVNGLLQKHSEWSSCQQRVKGISGARFKKITMAGEEEKILSGWGYKSNC